MVEHDGHGQMLQHLLQLDDFVAFGHELDMPAMIRDLACDGGHVVHRCTAGQARAEPDSSDACLVQAG